MKDLIINIFYDIFNYSGQGSLYFAPGRVNLIGEHTDYTGGLVLPFGINAGTYIYAIKNNSSNINIYSNNFKDGIITIDTLSLLTKKSHWTDYLKSVLFILSKDKFNISSGFDAVIYGNIPDSSGLSSSASFELASIMTILDQNGYSLPNPGSSEMVNFALVGQRAENEFIGLNCGIMDQFACANSKENHVIQLNCSDLSFKYAPIPKNKYDFLIINTNKKRRLEESKYNERRAECEKGFNLLKQLGLTETNLGHITVEKYNTVRNEITDQILLKRLDHVVYENDRVKKAVIALESNNILVLAELVNQSGVSLRDNYEVTGFHLDSLVNIAKTTDGVIASRMTGAGFGGCTVNIVESDKLKEASIKIENEYMKQTGLKPEFYSYKAGNGALKIF